MKKRVVCAALSLVLAASLLSGCGAPAGNGQTNGGGAAQGAESAPGAESASGVGSAPGASGGGGSEETDASGAGASGAAPQEASGGEEKEVPILKKAVADIMGCRIGCAVTESELKDPKVWEIITTHFNAVTFGNELKPDALVGYSVDRCPGTETAELNGEAIVVPKLDYSRAERMLDKVYDWNAEHPDDKIMVRGHVLVWHSQTPEWFFHVDYDKNKDYVDKETMNKRLEWYIRTVLTHFTGEGSKYQGMFYGWDVVNEAISDGANVYRSDNENPDEPLSNDRHGSNSSWWHIYQSNEYIINAFIYANKYAPPEMELYYNDYNECVSSKMPRIMELLQAIKEKEGAPGEGTRISAMGMQGHYDMESPKFNELSLAVERYAGIVGNVQITELDLKASSGYDGSDESKKKEYQDQYRRYKVLYSVLQTSNGADDINVTGITFWGTVDHYSWLQTFSNVGGGSTKRQPQCPLLFDDQYQVKPAFYAFTEKKSY